jgi:RNA-dependent RNA polymerase
MTASSFGHLDMEIFMHNMAFAATVMDVRLALAEKLHRPPFPTDPPMNFGVHLFQKKRLWHGHSS